MSRPPKAVSAYLAAIGAAGGRKGGKAKGASKRRTPAHYEMLAAMKRKKDKK
jgi:hypothetical protein